MLEIKQKPHQRVARHTNKLSPLFRGLKKILIATTILTLLFALGAAAYIWYNGQYGEQPKTVTFTPKPVVSKKPTLPSQTGKIGASVQFITSPIAPGENATISIRTNALANCTIKVEYGSDKVLAKDSGLMPKKADDYGMVTWGWTVPVGTPLGKWPVTVLCANLKNSGQVIGDLEVKR